MVDVWLVYKHSTQIKKIQKEFNSYLVEELIDKVYNMIGTRWSKRSYIPKYPVNKSAVVAQNGILRSGADINFTPTKKMIKMNGKITK